MNLQTDYGMGTARRAPTLIFSPTVHEILSIPAIRFIRENEILKPRVAYRLSIL